MMTREDMREYALQICVPLMERALRRAKRGDLAFKPDQVGYVPAALENFCRPFWGITPLLAQGEEIMLDTDDGSMSVFDYMRILLREGLTQGNDVGWGRYRECFPDYVYENQNITELAGLAIGMYFAREQLWEPLTLAEKETLATALYDMAETAFDHSWPNNHYWFPLFTITVLKRFGYCFARTEEMLDKGLNFLDSLYLGEGWYKDGEFGRFDYYEAWSLHLYPLLWTLIADDSFAGYKERKYDYVERTNRFLPFYTYWFDAQGANVPFGRSLSYRFAACALFPVAVLAGCEIDPGLAGRITAMNIGFFQNNCRMEESDILSQGYLYRTDNVIEGYTSDGGAYWCCKAFLALLIPEDHPFWNCGEARLPAEKGNYLVEPANRDIHMLFEGHNGMVTMYNNTAQYYLHPKDGALTGKMTHRFGNVRNWYSKFAYHSAGGFGCSGVDNISIDSMIALMTPDGSMTSHRFGFMDLGYRDGVLHSWHVPFANDPDTVIESRVLPLGGMHVRIHKVRLSRPYFVSEGGFSLARWDDYCPKKVGDDYALISNHEYTSVLTAVADTEIMMGAGAPQASFHIYAPLAEYPTYTTRTALAAGEYLFAAAFALCRKDAIGEIKEHLPKLALAGDKVEITVKGRVYQL